MDARDYLPSGQFIAMLSALLLSSGLIFYAASNNPQFNPKAGYLSAVAGTPGQDPSSANPNWQQQFTGDTVPEQAAALQTTAATLSQAVETKNLTDSVGRSILINSGALSGQGVSGDPTAAGDAVSQALSMAQAQNPASAPAYTQNDFSLAPNSQTNLHQYGNALAQTINDHPAANEGLAILPFTQAIDANSATPLSRMSINAAQYRAVGKAIMQLPTPSILEPVALQLANNYDGIANSISDMQQVIGDPLRGLLGLQTFTTLSTQNVELDVQINTAFTTGGVTFAKNDPGATWTQLAAIVEAQAQQQATQSNNSSTTNAPQTIFSP